MTQRSRLARVGTCLSQFLNVLVFNGDPDESTSARAWREGVLEGCPIWARRRRWVNRLFWRDPDHCRKAHDIDLVHARALLKNHEANG